MGRGSDLDHVEVGLVGQALSLPRVQDTELLVAADHAHLRHADLFVYAKVFSDRASSNDTLPAWVRRAAIQT